MGSGGFNPVEMFVAGGWVMYPILLLGIISFSITLERLIVILLEKRKLNPEAMLDYFMERLEANGGDKIKAVDETAAHCEKRGGVTSEVALSVLNKFKDGISKGMGPSEIKKWMQDAAESKANTEIPVLEAHLLALAVIANVSTLMGLFGTVIGMIESFLAMAKSPGGVKADEMAGGIAVALVATAGGLIVAVPSLILYNFIKSYTGGYVVDLESAVTRVVDILAE